MTVVSQDLIGRQVRVTRSQCSTSGCRTCERNVGREGVLSSLSSDSYGPYAYVGGEGFIREVTLLNAEAPSSYFAGQRVRVTGGQGNHGWANGTVVTLVARAPHIDTAHNQTMWLATQLTWRVGEERPRHMESSGAVTRYIAEAAIESEAPVTFANLDAPSTETFTSQRLTWTVGERVTNYGSLGTVMSPTDPGYNTRFGHPVNIDRFVPVRFDDGRIDGIQAPNLVRVPNTTPTNTEEIAMPSRAVTFTPEQEERLREVVGRLGREHGACAVAATALQELGVSQPQQTQVATVTIELRIPLANSSGQVQLPTAASTPADYLSKAIGARELNALADRMLSDGGRGARSYRRQGDATATITNIA